MSKSINHKWQYSQPPAEVWEYLTKPELIEQWLMKNDFQPIVGHQFNFLTRPLPNFDFDGIVYCTVLEVVQNQRLSYSWKGGPGDGKITLDSVVVWILTPNDKGTELELIHTGFKEVENSIMYAVMNDGWLKNIEKIAELLNGPKNDTTSA